MGAYGFREGVAVFYDSTKLQFIGPYLLSEVKRNLLRAHPPDQAGHDHIRDYPDDFNELLPNLNNPLPALQVNRLHNVNIGGVIHAIPEYQFAGQWDYYRINPDTGNNERIAFPNNVEDNRDTNTYCHRGPFHTRFLDLTAGANNRTINLFSVHTSPGSAAAAVNQLGLVPEIINDIPDNTVNVIAGDFNVDAFDMRRNGSYVRIMERYTMHLDPRFNDVVTNARKPYCMTHFLPRAQATPFGIVNLPGAPDQQHNVYPRFGYMGSMGGRDFTIPVNSGAIDNIFTWYGALTNAPANHNISIVNTITGKPYNLVAPPPAGVSAELTGGLAYNRSLANPFLLPNGVDSTLGAPSDAEVNIFRQWNNFRRIYSTSDHLPIVIEI
jgi:hypothetical protein